MKKKQLKAELRRQSRIIGEQKELIASLQRDLAFSDIRTENQDRHRLMVDRVSGYIGPLAVEHTRMLEKMLDEMKQIKAGWDEPGGEYPWGDV